MSFNFYSTFGKLYPMKPKAVEPDKIPWTDLNYMWDVKYDGDRRTLSIGEDKIAFTSRGISKKTGFPVDKADNIPHIAAAILDCSLEKTIFDGEITHPLGFEYVRKIMGSLPEKAIKDQEEFGYTQYVIFDIICYKGRFVTDMPYKERRMLLQEIVSNYIDSDYIGISKVYPGGNEKMLRNILTDIIIAGGEGMVAKHVDSHYRLSDEKCLVTLKNGWIKIKRDFVGDFVITGYEPAKIIYDGNSIDTHEFWMDEDSGFFYNLFGEDEAESLSTKKNINLVPITKYHYYGWIGALRYSEYREGKLIDMGTVSSGLTEDVRENITMNKDDYLNKVIQLSAMERDKKTTYLRHPVLDKFRPDKEPGDCIYEHQKG